MAGDRPHHVAADLGAGAVLWLALAPAVGVGLPPQAPLERDAVFQVTLGVQVAVGRLPAVVSEADAE